MPPEATAAAAQEKRKAAREVINVLEEISTLLVSRSTIGNLSKTVLMFLLFLKSVLEILSR